MYSPRVRETPHFQDEFSRFFLILQLRTAPTQAQNRLQPRLSNGHRTSQELVLYLFRTIFVFIRNISYIYMILHQIFVLDPFVTQYGAYDVAFVQNTDDHLRRTFSVLHVDDARTARLRRITGTRRRTPGGIRHENPICPVSPWRTSTSDSDRLPRLCRSDRGHAGCHGCRHPGPLRRSPSSIRPDDNIGKKPEFASNRAVSINPTKPNPTPLLEFTVRFAACPGRRARRPHRSPEEAPVCISTLPCPPPYLLAHFAEPVSTPGSGNQLASNPGKRYK